ncbi:hypothetical protein [Mesorhizobium sp. INR15]|uniref:hypothetical protein n=1 Tax=Mesorhizobium sp. INR15 TaxID=2654248 RepID=UPI0018966CB5|nr:hypothetical protein [Mesorhizobium sp. INR15]QPC95373.1 hypothetical protein GA829_32615 [Mesorhizobium sp. INR15]
MAGPELFPPRGGEWPASSATEAILFVYLIFSYVYLGSQQTGPWPPSGPPSLKLVIPNTVILVASSFVVAWGQSQFRQTGKQPQIALRLAGTIILGSAFIIIQAFEWAGKRHRALDQCI